MRKLFFVFLIAIPLLAGESEICRLVSQKGNVQMRLGYEESWSAIEAGKTLEALVTVRAGDASQAVFEAFDGSAFTLPANAQIEIRELKKMSRDEVIMELTALELQKLPSPSDKEKPAQAFVLHGAPPDIEDEKDQREYLALQENGAVALYEQGFVSGFILKWNRLHYQFPNVQFMNADKLIESAYEQMDMPGRLKAVKQ